jgi:hypothetical protein
MGEILQGFSGEPNGANVRLREVEREWMQGPRLAISGTLIGPKSTHIQLLEHTS